MGADKAALSVGGVPLAVRVARALAAAADPVLAVGGEAGTGFDAVSDPGVGPLTAFTLGAEALASRGCRGPILLVACDLPFVTAALLRLVAGSLAGADASVPVLGGRDQPLAACFSQRAVAVAADLVRNDRHSMQALLSDIDVHRIAEEQWSEVAPADALTDVDTPDDLAWARAAATERGEPADDHPPHPPISDIERPGR